MRGCGIWDWYLLFYWIGEVMIFFLQNSNDGDKKKDEIKPPGSPYDKKEEANGNGQTNGHVANGIPDDDKTFK